MDTAFSDTESDIDQNISPVIVLTESLKQKKPEAESESHPKSIDDSTPIHWSDSSSTTDEDDNDPQSIEDRKKRLKKKQDTKAIDKKTYSCKELEKYASKGSLVLDRTAECRVCQVEIPTERIARKHFQKEHPNDQAFTCPEFGDIGGCDFKTNWFGEVKKHLVRMHPLDIVEKYAAPQEEDDDSLRPNDPRPYLDTRTLTECRLCFQNKKSISLLVRHVQVMHPGEKPFSCRFGCDFITSRPNRLRKHFFQNHPLEPLQPNVTEKSKKTIAKRKKSSREEMVRIQRVNRAKQAAKERKLLAKPKKPRREKCAWEKQQHLCRICTFQGNSDAIMMNHFSLKHPEAKAFVCPLEEEQHCEYSTMWSYEIKRHILRMHPDSQIAQMYPQTKYKARREKCAWEKQHHVCRICTFHGNSDTIMMNHFALKHPEAKAFVCPLEGEQNCEYSTMWSCEIKRHILRMHPDSQIAQMYLQTKNKANPGQDQRTEEERAVSSINIENEAEPSSNNNE